MIVVSQKTQSKLERVFPQYVRACQVAIDRMNDPRPLRDGHRFLFKQIVVNFHRLRRSLIALAVRSGKPRKEVAEFYGVSLSQVSYAVRNFPN